VLSPQWRPLAPQPRTAAACLENKPEKCCGKIFKIAGHKKVIENHNIKNVRKKPKRGSGGSGLGLELLNTEKKLCEKQLFGQT